MIVSNQLKSARRGEDDGDVIIKSIHIDVKTSFYTNAHLWITENKKHTNLIDGYVLMTGNVDKSNNFFYKGYLDHDFILKNWNNTCSKTSGKFSQKELIKLPF